MKKLSETPSLKGLWKGLLPYQQSLSLQKELKEQVAKTSEAFFMGFECPACITLGLRGQTEQDLKGPKEKYKNIEIAMVNRGGQATLHSLGQLVIYPVMDLLQWKIRLRDFLSLLEKITQNTLKKYGIYTKKQEKFAGLFTEKGKIVFFGVHVSQGVSQHGLSINVKNDLSLFQLIRSCGVSDRPHDSFHDQNIKVELKEVFQLWCEEAKTLFLKHYQKDL